MACLLQIDNVDTNTMWWGQYKYKYKNKYLHQVVGSVQIQILTPGGGASTKSSPGRIHAASLFQLVYKATMKGGASR